MRVPLWSSRDSLTQGFCGNRLQKSVIALIHPLESLNFLVGVGLVEWTRSTMSAPHIHSMTFHEYGGRFEALRKQKVLPVINCAHLEPATRKTGDSSTLHLGNLEKGCRTTMSQSILECGVCIPRPQERIVCGAFY